MKGHNHILTIMLTLISTSILLSSCSQSKQLFNAESYLDPATDSLLVIDNKSTYRIQQNDKVSLSIWNHDDLSIGSLFGIYNSNEVYGKWVLVDKEGFITIPKLGKIKVINKTCDEAAAMISKMLAKTIKEPIVVVKVLNNSVTIIGEVRTPGTFVIEEEYFNLWQLVSKAEGFEYYADLENVKLIRGSEDNPRIYLLNLTEDNSHKIHNFKLLPGDVIYVPANKGKDVEKKSGRIIPITAIITTAVLLFTQINK